MSREPPVMRVQRGSWSIACDGTHTPSPDSPADTDQVGMRLDETAWYIGYAGSLRSLVVRHFPANKMLALLIIFVPPLCTKLGRRSLGHLLSRNLLTPSKFHGRYF